MIPQASPLHRRQLRAAMLLDWLATLPPSSASRLSQCNDLQRRLADGLRMPGYGEFEVLEVLGWPDTQAFLD